jgi:hypothetical protein
MSNASARVARAFRSKTNENFSHSWGTLSASLQLYNGAMVGLNGSGYLAKFDDTAAFKFMGIVLDDPSLGGGQGPKLPSDGSASATQGANALFVDFKQPLAFELAISGVAITDIGRRVYALDDQTGTLDPSATTYGNFVGVVKDLVYAADGGSAVSGYALVAPLYDQPSGSPLQVLGASGAVAVRQSVVVISKVGVAALTLADPTTGVHDGLVMDFTSVTASAHTITAPSGFNASGTLATFGGAKGDSLRIVAYAGKWYTVGSPRNITFS